MNGCRGVCLFGLILIGLMIPWSVGAENICNETPPENFVVDGIPAYAQCDNSSGSVFSDNGIDTRSESGGSGWVRTQWSGGYQCTEFAHRYLAFVWNVSSVPNGNAGSWCDNALPAGLVKTETPVHGDLIVFAPGSCGAASSTGHVAVVDIVDDSTLTIVEQNRASRRRCKVSCAKCFLHASINNGIVSVRNHPSENTVVSGFTVLSGRNSVAIRLPAGFSSGASVRIYNLHGRLVADLTDKVSGGVVVYKAAAGSPSSLVVSVRKGSRVFCGKIVLLH